MNILWSPEAIEDLNSLRAYVAQDNPSAARAVALHIAHSIEQLLPDNPQIGRPGRVPGTHELVIPKTSLIVPYRLQRNVVQILRVYYEARVAGVMTHQEVVIVPRVAQEGEDDARSVSVMHHLWNTLEVLKKQTDVAAWAAHGLLDLEEFLECLETGRSHPVLEAWQKRKSEFGNRPPATSREQHARRLAVLACVALDREGFGTDLVCRRFVARKLAAAKIFARAPSAEALRNWRRTQVALTPRDETVIANARRAETKPEQLVRYFVGLMHLAHTPAPLLKISPSP